MSPVQVRVIRLRYINRILVPLKNGQVDLRRYLRGSPRSADGKLMLTGFLNQYAAVEKDTGHEVNVVVTSQPPEMPGCRSSLITAPSARRSCHGRVEFDYC